MEQMDDGAAIFRNPPAGGASDGLDKDFYYLTGFKEPNAVCLLVRLGQEYKSIIFVQPKDRDREIWTGKRAGVEKARELVGADEAHSIDELDEKLPGYLSDAGKIYYRMGEDEEFNVRVFDLLKHYQSGIQYDRGPHTLIDAGEIVHEMRVIKDDKEMELMRKAAQITAEAQRAAMKTVEPGMYEYELEALMNYTYRKNGAGGSAFTPIVAAGPNAVYLHYKENDRQIQDGDLVLIDSGAKYECYASDVTRTFPANGRFSEAQKAIYNVVLEAQLTLIQCIKPGTTYEQYNQTANRAITEGLLKIGLLSGDIDELMESRAYMKFYMHSAGHWIGLDTHDVGKYRANGKSRAFEPGMVITPDTGIYIAENLDGVDPKYWNIGIRIEDDALVTETECEILSYGIPKTAEEVEKFMRER